MIWVAYKQQKLVSHGSGGWKSEIRMSAGPGSGEDPLLGLQTAWSVPVHREREKERAPVSLLRRIPV